MGKPDDTLLLNLGCGSKKLDGYVNVDFYGDPDIRHDLNAFPYPWDDNSVDHIVMTHVLEHIPDWWSAFCECARILKPGGTLRVHVPDESSSTALAYRDHHHVFHRVTFDSIVKNHIAKVGRCTNTWFLDQDEVSFTMIEYQLVPFSKYNWMFRWPFTWLGEFCADHMRNFIWEQRFLFQKG
jgi:SAM-dependent methyltransferase